MREIRFKKDHYLLRWDLDPAAKKKKPSSVPEANRRKDRLSGLVWGALGPFYSSTKVASFRAAGTG